MKRHDTIKTFYEENRHGLYTYALSLTHCPATAEDAVHTAICKLLSADKLPQALKPYAFTCTRHAAIDNWRKHESRNDGEPDAEQLSRSAPVQTKHDLAALLNLLKPVEREVITLKALHGFTFKEIATINDISINTISSHYRRGLQKLNDLTTEDNHEKP